MSSTVRPTPAQRTRRLIVLAAAAFAVIVPAVQIFADLGLSQAEFAARFRVPVGTLRDWEQARATAPDFAVAYVRVIRRHADLVAAAVA